MQSFLVDWVKVLHVKQSRCFTCNKIICSQYGGKENRKTEFQSLFRFGLYLPCFNKGKLCERGTDKLVNKHGKKCNITYNRALGA